jgi:hypothetical protein
MRFVITGKSDGVPVGTRYKSLSAAKKFADTLVESEVYDSQTNKYVYGTSKFMEQLRKQGELK